MNPQQIEAVTTLVHFLEEEISYLQNSRVLYLPPAERSRRIRQRQSWILTIKELAPGIEAEP